MYYSLDVSLCFLKYMEFDYNGLLLGIIKIQISKTLCFVVCDCDDGRDLWGGLGWGLLGF